MQKTKEACISEVLAELSKGICLVFSRPEADGTATWVVRPDKGARGYDYAVPERESLAQLIDVGDTKVYETYLENIPLTDLVHRVESKKDVDELIELLSNSDASLSDWMETRDESGKRAYLLSCAEELEAAFSLMHSKAFHVARGAVFTLKRLARSEQATIQDEDDLYLVSTDIQSLRAIAPTVVRPAQDKMVEVAAMLEEIHANSKFARA